MWDQRQWALLCSSSLTTLCDSGVKLSDASCEEREREAGVIDIGQEELWSSEPPWQPVYCQGRGGGWEPGTVHPAF